MKKERDKLIFENKQLKNTLHIYLMTVPRIPAMRPFTSVSV